MNKSNKVIISLVIIIICLILSGGFVIYSILDDTPKENLGGANISDDQMSGTGQEKYYNLNNINNIIVEVPKVNSDGPEMENKTITNKDEIKSILANIDGAVFVKKIADGVGFTGNTSITINYNGDPSTKIILLNSGNMAMNLAIGAGESGYAEYSINNKKFEEELINKYQTKTIEWINYLNQYNLTLIGSVWNADKNECVFEKTSISSSDVKKIIDELSSQTITKYYYGNNPPTGTVCSDRYKITYNNNNVSLESDGIMWVNDQNLIKKLDLDVDNKIGSTGEFVYQFDVDFAEIIRKYINK